MTVRFRSNTIDVQTLANEGVKYDLLLSPPDMKQLQRNFYWDDTVSVGLPPSRSTDSGAPQFHFAPSSQLTTFLSVSRTGVRKGYPASTTKLEILFELSDKTVERKRPYDVICERRLWLKQDFQSMLDSDIIWPFIFSFASPITIAPKGDGTFRLYTDCRTVGEQTSLVLFLMPYIDTVTDETGTASTFQGLTCASAFGRYLCERTQRRSRRS